MLLEQFCQPIPARLRGAPQLRTARSNVQGAAHTVRVPPLIAFVAKPQIDCPDFRICRCFAKNLAEQMRPWREVLLFAIKSRLIPKPCSVKSESVIPRDCAAAQFQSAHG